MISSRSSARSETAGALGRTTGGTDDVDTDGLVAWETCAIAPLDPGSVAGGSTALGSIDGGAAIAMGSSPTDSRCVGVESVMRAARGAREAATMAASFVGADTADAGGAGDTLCTVTTTALDKP